MLGAALEHRGVTGELYMVGGAAIAMAFDERRSTRDIDAVFEPQLIIDEAAAEVARERGLPVGWLNDAADPFGDRLDAAARFFVEQLFAPE